MSIAMQTLGDVLASKPTFTPLTQNELASLLAPARSPVMAAISVPQIIAAPPAATALHVLPNAHDAKAAIDFLKWLDCDGWHNLWAKHPESGNMKGRTFAPGSWSLVEAFINNHQGWNLYNSANEPRPDAPHKKLGRTDIANVRVN
jgi:hypothetical protein